MVQVTKLSVIGTPGRIQTFAPKTESVLVDFPCKISATADTVFGMAATLDIVKSIAATVDIVKSIAAQVDCDK